MFSMVTLGADGWEAICFLQVLQKAVCCCETLCLISLKIHKQQKEWPQSERVTGLQKRSRQMPQTMSASVLGGPSDVIWFCVAFVAPESTPGMLKRAFCGVFICSYAFKTLFSVHWGRKCFYLPGGTRCCSVPGVVCMNQAKGASKASSFAVNPELVCIIKKNSPLPGNEPVSKHIEAIQCRRAKEVAVFLRACSLRF